MKGAKILVLGVAYKPDIADMRESPALKLISLLSNAGADVAYHDPYVPSFTEHGLQMSSVAVRARRVRLRRDRHRPPRDRLRAARRRREPRRRPAERDRREGHRVGQGLQALIGVAGLGYWGPNLARNFAELGTLTWLCDLDRRCATTFAARYPGATRDRLVRRAARRPTCRAS